MNTRALDGLGDAVERLADAIDDVPGHRGIDVPRQLNEAALETALTRFPTEIERIYGDAVPAKPGPGIKSHEPERLGAGGVDDFPDVDVHLPAHQRQFVHEADIDGAERVLQQLHHLGDARRRDADDR